MTINLVKTARDTFNGIALSAGSNIEDVARVVGNRRTQNTSSKIKWGYMVLGTIAGLSILSGILLYSSRSRQEHAAIQEPTTQTYSPYSR